MPNYRHALSLIACMTLAAPAFADPLDGTYIGERVLIMGDPTGCVLKDPVSVTIKGNALTFSDSQTKGYTISITPDPDGFIGQLASDEAGKIVQLRGHLEKDELDGDVIGPICSHHWHLVRKE